MGQGSDGSEMLPLTSASDWQFCALRPRGAAIVRPQRHVRAVEQSKAAHRMTGSTGCQATFSHVQRPYDLVLQAGPVVRTHLRPPGGLHVWPVLYVQPRPLPVITA